MRKKIIISLVSIMSALMLVFVFNVLGPPGKASAATTDPTTTTATTGASPTTSTTTAVTSPTTTQTATAVTPTSTTATPSVTTTSDPATAVTSSSTTTTSPVTAASAPSTATDSPIPSKEIPMKGNTAADANVTLGGTAINPGDTTQSWTDYSVGFNWSIPDYVQINAGDTATFTIPDNVNVTQPTSFPVKDPKGNTIGQFTILPGQKTGTLTFNNAFENTTTGRQGTIGFTAKGTSNTTEDKDFIVNKYGWINNTAVPSDGTTTTDGEHAPGSLTWNVAFNSASKDLTNVVLTDTIEPGQTYIKNSVTATYGYMLNGQYVSQGTIEPTSVELVGNQLIIKFDKVSNYIDLRYQTTVQNVNLDGVNKWHDKTTLTADQISAEAEHTIEWGGAGTGEGAKGSVIFTKVNGENNAPIPGAVFKIVNGAGKVIQEDLTTNEEGIIEVDDLAPGDYVLIETTVPDGYMQSSNYEWPFTIVEGVNEPVRITGIDVPIPEDPKTGQETLTKLDAGTDAVLQGAEFKLFDADGNVISSPLVTNDQGILELTNLAPGKYSLVEIKAPDGYELNPTPVEFEIKAGEENSVTVKDAKLPTTGSLTVLKVDIATNDPLKGAVFNILDANGKVVKSDLTTDDKGQIVVDGLPDGSYTLVEVTAPEGYLDNKAPVKFTITAGKMTTLTVSDTFDESDVTEPEPEPEVPEPEPEPSEPEPPVVKPVTPTVPEPGENTTSEKHPSVDNTPGVGKLPQTGNRNPGLSVFVGILLLTLLVLMHFVDRRDRRNR
ncbi:LPXTG cell wall anchor domain-containing protein [Lactobacillus salsicarnum]|uniref:LPXTG cell wall anchor domain-containing protein n=2 Tax=Companilactobacillus mishanensis TaxID=2486008 RepID=A0A5P0ZKA9_9LACO|nr:LPXTG cell wall anchor domain-containing protein [Companilactobacillus mishanensis]